MILFVLLNGGCAHVVPPSGGPMDRQPPQVVQVSPPCQSTPTSPIRIRFNEIVRPRNGGKVWVNPVVPYEVKWKKREVVVILDSVPERLQIVFYQAVQDVTEGNVMSYFECIWARDSSQIGTWQGMGVRFPGGQRVSQLVFRLTDSLGQVYYQQGTHWSAFSGTYQALWWHDSLSNGRWDAGEAIGGGWLTVPDSNQVLVLGPEDQRLRHIVHVRPAVGMWQVPAGGWDSLTVIGIPWFREGDRIYLPLDTTPDTVQIRLWGQWDTLFRLVRPAQTAGAVQLKFSDGRTDTVLPAWVDILLPEWDTLEALSLQINGRDTQVSVLMLTPFRYRLTLQPRSAYQLVLKGDTFRWSTMESTECAQLTLRRDSLWPVMVQTTQFQLWWADSLQRRTWTCLPPGKISLWMLQDRNGDRRWNRGNHRLGLAPEPFWQIKTLQLKPGWQYEETLSAPTAR